MGNCVRKPAKNESVRPTNFSDLNQTDQAGRTNGFPATPPSVEELGGPQPVRTLSIG